MSAAGVSVCKLTGRSCGRAADSVNVEAADRERRWVIAGGGGRSRRERAVAVAQQHAHGAVAGVRDGEVQKGIVVEAPGDDRLGAGAGGVAHGGAEAEQAAILQGL